MWFAALFVLLLALLRPPVERLVFSSLGLSLSTDAYLVNVNQNGMVSLSVVMVGFVPARLSTTSVPSPSPELGFFHKFRFENGPVCPLYTPKLVRKLTTAVPSIPPRTAPTCVNRHLSPTFEVPAGGSCVNRHLRPTFEVPGLISPYVRPGLKLPEVPTACRLEDTPGPVCPVYIPRLFRLPTSAIPFTPPGLEPICHNRHLHPTFEVPGAFSPYSPPRFDFPEVVTQCILGQVFDIGGIPGVCHVPTEINWRMVKDIRAVIWSFAAVVSAILVGFCGYMILHHLRPRACHKGVETVDRVRVDDEVKINNEVHVNDEHKVATSPESTPFPQIVCNVEAPLSSVIGLLFAPEDMEMDDESVKPGVEASILAPSVTTRSEAAKPVPVPKFDVTVHVFTPTSLSFVDLNDEVEDDDTSKPGVESSLWDPAYPAPVEVAKRVPAGLNVKASVFTPTRSAIVDAGDDAADTLGGSGKPGMDTSTWAPSHMTSAKPAEPVRDPIAKRSLLPEPPASTPTRPPFESIDDNDMEDDSHKPGISASIWATTFAAASVPRHAPIKAPHTSRFTTKTTGRLSDPRHTPSPISTDDSLNSSMWAPRHTSTPVNAQAQSPSNRIAPLRVHRNNINSARWVPDAAPSPAARRPLARIENNISKSNTLPLKASIPAPRRATPCQFQHSLKALKTALAPAPSPSPRKVVTASLDTPIEAPAPKLQTTPASPPPTSNHVVMQVTDTSAAHPTPSLVVDRDPIIPATSSHSLKASRWAPSPAQSPAPSAALGLLTTGTTTRPTPKSTPAPSPSPDDTSSDSNSLRTSPWAPSPNVIYASSTVRPPSPSEDDSNSRSVASSPRTSLLPKTGVWRPLPHMPVPIVEPPPKRRRVRTRRMEARCDGKVEKVEKEGSGVVVELMVAVMT